MGTIRQWENYLSDSTQCKTKYSIISGCHLSFAPENRGAETVVKYWTSFGLAWLGFFATWCNCAKKKLSASKANKVFADRFLIALTRIKYMDWNGMHLQVGPFPTLNWFGCKQLNLFFFSSSFAKMWKIYRNQQIL